MIELIASFGLFVNKNGNIIQCKPAPILILHQYKPEKAHKTKQATSGHKVILFISHI